MIKMMEVYNLLVKIRSTILQKMRIWQ